ncbi:hypothetical protein DDZ14_08445 [Maritimibacter sp. 55A14]|uniref:hypothetical protein n=1 Tax=Maritimibacter sp. 55A14 TaxID=2174844 RepID=UPI000D613739|nr:hypothetical protein [Maritimibacter sp. 55A14]PWE32766.1 hypothetical protein DDZ14_08445 [Maritimibacter sp. 55A14]
MTMTSPLRPRPVDTDTLPEYPLTRSDRLDSHYFMIWERRRWLNSEMRLKGTPECRAIYFDLINVAFDQSPIGTLPDDIELLSKLALVERGHLQALCAMPYGPLHRWEPCLCEAEVRLMHPMVLSTISEAISRKADNRARNDAANAKKRRQRLRSAVAGYHPDLAKNDAAILWMDEWLDREGCEYRAASWIERAISGWSDHMLALTRGRRVNE